MYRLNWAPTFCIDPNMLIINRKILARQWLAAAITIFISTVAHGEIYKQVDANGRVTYSNVPMKGATRLNLEPINTVPASRSRTAAPSPDGFPKVDSDTQKKRDDTRRKILEDELSAEEKLLADARKKPSKDKDEVELHEKNVAALKKELANLK